jgi:hypothetical protein
MGDRFSRSLALTKQSFAVLKSNPQLAMFPIISGILSLVVMGSFVVPFALAVMAHPHGDVPNYINYPLLFAFYFCTSFVVIFFNAGLVSVARATLEGRKASVSDGLADAVRHIVPILGWTLIAASVGMILRMISERSGIIGKLVVSLLGMGWTLLTFFVVPVLVIDNKGPVTAVKESGSMLRNTWGERLIFGVSSGLVFGLLALIGLIPLAIGIAITVSTDAVVPLVICVAGSLVYWLGLAIVASSLNGVYQTALYLYGRTGAVPTAYSPDLIQYAFTVKEKKGFLGR